MSSVPQKKNLILVIGATGAQGLAVVDALLSPSADGSPSPYRVRALTRSPNGRRATELAQKGVEIAVGRFDDYAAVRQALDGCYGAYVNTDGFTVGEEREMYAGMRIFEAAKQTAGLRHYLWSNLDYTFKKSGYDETYRVPHSDGKGRVGEWLRAQPSDPEGLVWSCITSAPYMEMLHFGMFGPWHVRADGTHEFYSPIAAGQVPLIALADLGWWARYSFDNREEVSARDLEIASEPVGWDHLVQTFTRVTGFPATYMPLSLDEWFAQLPGSDEPLASEDKEKGNTDGVKWREDFAGWWSGWRDGIIKRDWEWLRKVHPTGHTLESWMRTSGYKGEKNANVLANVEAHENAIFQNKAEAQAEGV